MFKSARQLNTLLVGMAYDYGLGASILLWSIFIGCGSDHTASKPHGLA